eukprot:3739860-Pyramimonas_sp.AAC.1
MIVIETAAATWTWTWDPSRGTRRARTARASPPRASTVAVLIAGAGGIAVPTAGELPRTAKA